jgi:two-component system, OmpR family, sensor kinase
VRSAGIQLRVAVAAAVAIVVAVAALGIAVLARLDAQLNDALDRSLRARATEVARLSASTPGLLTMQGTLEGRLGGSPLFVQVIDSRGRIVARSTALGSRVLPDAPVVQDALDDRRPGYGDARLGTDPVRVYAAPLGELGRGPAAGGAVIVAGSTAEIEDTLDTTRRFVLLSSVAAALLAAALATVLARRALRPLRRLSSGARAIERTGDASRRLPDPHARDEVGTLAETLNAMLASLERARDAEQRFVGDASHELRTPLTALRGNLAFVTKHGADPEVLRDIERDAARLGDLLDDLLALAREDAAAPVHGEPVDLAELARDADADEVDAPEPAVVLGERPALERALGNLVRNARKHGRGQVSVAAERDGDRARLSVADEGPGLTPQQAVHAFERFWRGPDPAAPGSGLGLAIVRAIAERHKGHVTVDGSRFTIDLPALRSPHSGVAEDTADGQRRGGVPRGRPG